VVTSLRAANLCSASLIVGSFVAGMPAALAQSETANEEEFLNTIVVTAQKREENSQDVPISITTFSGDTLKDLGVDRSDQLGQFVPGVEVVSPNGPGGQLVIFLRGAGLNDFNTNNAGPIGVYSDEVFINSPVLTSLQVFDTERVEILKGPQGTLYGRNTTGGAIRFITNKPTSEFDFDLTAGIENFGTRRLEAAIGGPIADGINARAAIRRQTSDGFGVNILDGSNFNAVDLFSYRATVDVDVTDNFFVRLNVHGAKDRSQAIGFRHLGLTTDGSTPCSVELAFTGACVDALGYRIDSDDVFEGEFDNLRDITTDTVGGYIEAQWSIGSVNLTSVTAFDDLEHIYPEDNDASPLDLLEIDFGVESETFSQELRLDGSSDRANWVAGLYYLSEDLTQNQTIDLFGQLRAFTGGLSDPTGSVTGAPILFGRTVNVQETEAFAVFGQISYELADDFTVTVGGRYTDETKRFDALTRLEDEAVFGPNGFTIINLTDLENNDGAFSWRIAADYSINGNALAYASVSRGFKSGGFNGGFPDLDPVVATRQLQPFGPEFLTAYELGIKSDLFNGDLRLNAALFYNAFTDLQIFTRIDANPTPIDVLDNASDADVFGAEFEVVATPLEGLTLAASGAYLDTELGNFITDANIDLAGNRLAYSPEFSVSGLARYQFALPGDIGDISILADVAYKSQQFFSASNDVFEAQDAYAIANLRVAYEHSSRNWSVAGFVRNLTNTEYLRRATNLESFGFVQQNFGPPRTYGVELVLDF